MFKKTNPLVKFNLFLALVLSLAFVSCQQEESLTTSTAAEIELSVFEKHSAAQSQFIQVADQGEGLYNAEGEQGTVIAINNSLIYPSGEKVRGAIQIELKEIYSAADIILNRKQTLADYNGVNRMLESGGELFIEITQNGEVLTIASDGQVEVLLPTENTGGAKDGMELFYGEEIGEQIIWHPTGERIKVIDNAARNASYYYTVLEAALGWVNVDKIYAAGGEIVECIEVKIDCPELCEPNNTSVFMHVPGVNVGVEFNQIGPNHFQFCGIEGEGAVPLGGINVVFIVIVECPDGSLMVAFVNAVINPGYHIEYVDCGPFENVDPGQLEDYLTQLK